jgi:predicted dienelactone hydrolase
MRALLLGLTVLVSASAHAARLDPSGNGRFAVGVTTLTLVDASRSRTLVTEVWYPAISAGRGTILAAGHFPLVIVAHGNCGFRTNYEYLTIPLASWGFLVAAPDFPGFTKADCDAHLPAGDVVNDPLRDYSFLAAAFHDPASGASAFVRHMRGRRTGLVAHSLATLSAPKAVIDDRNFPAVVLLAPVNAFTAADFAGLRARRAFMAMGGTADTTLPYATQTVPLFAAFRPPAFLVEIVGGTHSGFTDMDGHLAPEALARQQALVRRYAVAHLRRYLAGDGRFARFLSARDAAAQGPDVELTARLRR